MTKAKKDTPDAHSPVDTHTTNNNNSYIPPHTRTYREQANQKITAALVTNTAKPELQDSSATKVFLAHVESKTHLGLRYTLAAYGQSGQAK